MQRKSFGTERAVGRRIDPFAEESDPAAVAERKDFRAVNVPADEQVDLRMGGRIVGCEADDRLLLAPERVGDRLWDW